MLDGLRWISIAACLYFATLTFAVPFQPVKAQSAAPDSQSQTTGTAIPPHSQILIVILSPVTPPLNEP